MDKLFHFDSPQEVYTSEACVISCFDARFDLATRKFLKRRGILTFDHVKIPGSAKWLAAPECEADRQFVLRMIRTSVRLHQSQVTLIVAHNDCGAYIGAPVETIAGEAVAAAQVVRAAIPGMPVECYFADFDGVYRIG